jgi:hypothetical protein
VEANGIASSCDVYAETVIKEMTLGGLVGSKVVVYHNGNQARTIGFMVAFVHSTHLFYMRPFGSPTIVCSNNAIESILEVTHVLEQF